LLDDEVFGAVMALRTNNDDRFSAARVKRVEDPNLNCQTLGSMALV
jgi:hypothetical protein